MPCNLVWGCFLLDFPWNRDPDCVTWHNNGNHSGAVENQPSNNEDNDGDGDGEGDNMAGHVEGVGGVAGSPSPDGTTSKAAAALAAAAEAAKTAKTFRAYLPSACHRRYSCVHCRAHLANHDELISKSFQGSQGRAYLFNSVVNIGCGPAEERILLTGLHAVADIYCDCCKTTLGWKYEQAFESSQKYKEGKYIIELAHMIKENGWENES